MEKNIWWFVDYGEIRPVEVVKETPKTVYFSRWGNGRLDRMNKGAGEIGFSGRPSGIYKTWENAADMLTTALNRVVKAGTEAQAKIDALKKPEGYE